MTAEFLPDIKADAYHQLPGLSSSIATTLIMKSPLHAWMQHPHYGGKGKKPTKAMNLGTVVHALVLGAGKEYAVLEYDNYKTKLAQEARDVAIVRGLVPILAHEHDEAVVIAAKVTHGLSERGFDLNGRSELAFTWGEPSLSGPVRCRGMADHVWVDRGVILDLKIVSDAEPSSVMKSAERFGYAIQAAAYSRALAAVRPELAGRVDFLFAFCETEPPYAMNLSRPDGVFREIGERRWLRAVESWGKSVAANKWDGYDGINYLTSPPWALTSEENAA